MGLFTYQCPKCKRVSEELHSHTIDPTFHCPNEGCDGVMKRIIIKGPAVHGTIDNVWRKEKQQRGY